MNCILLDDADFVDGESHVRLTGRRLRHVREVHRAAPGDELDVGRIGGRLGRGRVLRLDAEALELEVQLDREPPAPLPVSLVLALPRPPVLRRVLRTVAALGVKDVVLLNARRVEKSYWDSRALEPETVEAHLRRGLEIARDTVLPRVTLHRRFRPFVEDELPERVGERRGYVAHPEAPRPLPLEPPGETVLAIGPEGGFIPYEVSALDVAGLEPVHLGGGIGMRALHVEAAVPAILARLC